MTFLSYLVRHSGSILYRWRSLTAQPNSTRGRGVFLIEVVFTRVILFFYCEKYNVFYTFYVRTSALSALNMRLHITNTKCKLMLTNLKVHYNYYLPINYLRFVSTRPPIDFSNRNPRYLITDMLTPYLYLI